MAEIVMQYIVRKDKRWLMSGRPDVLDMPPAHVFSPSMYDAQRFDRRADASRAARRIGGTVYKFWPALGKFEAYTAELPCGAKCDNCRMWRPYDGVCRHPDSEYYRTQVSMNDVCDEWGKKA